MAAPKLNEEQRNTLIGWLAAEYSNPVILAWFKEREWPEITDATIASYRKRYAIDITTKRAERRDTAITTGLALKSERIERLKRHADELEVIKWVADPKSGRLWNEKVWRETLDDIAREMGHRRQGIDLTLEHELEAFLDRLRDNLDEETYARILALAAGETADSE